ncbi:hypothetical protein AOL_s00215g337 [Orbilia oligospora ATCC 24927]|uniref:F-box domain-containing protein n=1 Tax=Arthrobotrys oligospora (strain ATCC 24927 / CBS 115.81 / DSM 1491) TaxID=756982 RepID=G1XU58_ARTOA|nr:hypothetical protein AOL_s00215g337 [Orbilia oligospora ATCC 24927]EGX43601.1 hypothetical protein AOL_s00215g337 [Orbilia oligospora ATCC 24927]
MVATILSLPNEILSNIFNDRCLSNADLTRLQLTCSLFRDNIEQQTSRRYTFRVDAQGHPTWRLIRSLLKNPKLGERFSEITVRWERRNASNKETWTETWSWERDEIEKIHDLCEKWCIDDRTQRCIGYGINSEALLPLLLVFTTNLKSLDLGNIDVVLVTHTYQEWRSGAALWAIGESEHSDPQAEFDEKCQSHNPRDRDIFLFENLPYRLSSRRESRARAKDLYSHYIHRGEDPMNKPERTSPDPDSAVLPGLANLEHFRIGSESVEGYGSEPVHSLDVFAFLLLPAIKAIQAFGVSHLKPYSIGGYTGSIGDENVSTVKHLVLQTVGGGRAHTRMLMLGPAQAQVQTKVTTFVDVVAGITRNLESVYVKTGEDEGSEALGRAFLENNKATLVPANVIVDGDGFDDEGVFVPDLERKKALALKQKLWEQSRGNLMASNNKQSPLETLQPDILFKVTSFLEKCDSFNLILSSKNFQDACYRHNWFKLGFNNSSLISHDDLVIHNTLAQLESPIHIGWSLGVQDGVPPEFSVLRATLEAIKNGDIRGPKHIELDLTSYQPDDSVERIPNPWYRLFEEKNEPESDSESPLTTILPFGKAKTSEDDVPFNKHTTVLSIFKSFSKEKDPSEKFRISIKINLADISILKFCDMTKVTNLRLEEIWDGRQKRIGRSVDGLVMALSGLTDHLKTLSLAGEPYRRNASKEFEPADLWDKLQVLQEVVWKMKSLRSLTVSHHYLFHPSFILLPPEGVTSLTYLGIMSPLWWRKFASYHFAGVEELTLGCVGLGGDDGAERKYLQSSGEEIWNQPEEFRLDSIQISGLRWISFEDLADFGLHYPADLLPLVLQNNPRISEHSIKVLVKDRSGRFNGGKLKKRLPAFVERHSRRLLDILQKSYADLKDESILEYLLTKKTLPNDRIAEGLFEAEIEKVMAERMVKEFEERFAAISAEETTKALRRSLMD